MVLNRILYKVDSNSSSNNSKKTLLFYITFTDTRHRRALSHHNTGVVCNHVLREDGQRGEEGGEDGSRDEVPPAIFNAEPRAQGDDDEELGREKGDQGRRKSETGNKGRGSGRTGP